MCDKLVYDLAQEVEGSPCVFVRKDWINILDNQNQSYISNQSVLDTSQLSNSNKWMSYREAYFSVPLTLTLVSTGQSGSTGNTEAVIQTVPAPDGNGLFEPTKPAKSADFAVGLKNWYGNIIHSFTLDYNGTTIIQQTPFVNMWNSFKLMTSLSYQDVLTQGPTIGFYPDTAESFEFYDNFQGNTSGAQTASGLITPPVNLITNVDGTLPIASYIPGMGACNNSDVMCSNESLGISFTHFKSGLGNMGFLERQKWISFDLAGTAGLNVNARQYGNLLTGGSLASSEGKTALGALWKGYIFNKQDQTGSIVSGQTVAGVIQYCVVATVYLKHIHSFFNMIPLLKGVFMKMTMNLNNCTSTLHVGTAGIVRTTPLAVTDTPNLAYQMCESVQSALGGSNIAMLASNDVLFPFGQTATTEYITITGTNGANSLLGGIVGAIPNGLVAGNIYYWDKGYKLNVSVGAVCLDSSISNITGVMGAPLSKSIYLYIPAYTFNPTFEQSYLSSPIKQIKYTDIYQYQALNCAGGSNTNTLLTNGIADIKSVLVLPFYSSSGTGVPTLNPRVSMNPNSGFTAGLPVWQSPFDDAGCGPTSPLCHLTNFNIQVSGQNAIYNLQKYNFEQFNNQLYGQNAVNGGLTDGITSSMISRQSFDLKYCYYYVNVERMLPVEQSVPKSIQLLAQNESSKAVDFICFIEYGTQISIDSITGARV